jgi:hypothetical protein
MPAILNCPKARSANIYDRRKAKYEGLTTLRGGMSRFMARGAAAL